MIIKVFYHSNAGKTTRLAEAIARAAGVPFEAIGDDTKIQHADLLIIGDEVDSGKADPQTERFIAGLDGNTVKHAVVFGTGSHKKGLAQLKGLLKARGITVEEEMYGCNGKTMGFLNSKHPDDKDLADAVMFVNPIIRKYKA
jgi:flavodoxin